MKPFLELHYYNGGLRTKIIGQDGIRPNWAPALETVGFRDEFPLGPEDAIVEIVKFPPSQFYSSLFWVGLYQNSPDQVYGDRHNHAGVGIWLPDRAPTEPALLILGLKSLLGLFKKSPADLNEKATAFINNYADSVITGYSELPKPLGGLRACTGPLTQTLRLFTVADEEDFESLIDLAVSRLFYLNRENEDAGRALILLSGINSAGIAETRGFKRLTTASFLTELLSNLPAAFSSQNNLIKALESRLASEKSRGEILEGEVSRARGEIALADERVARLASEVSELRTPTLKSPEVQRLSFIDHRLTENLRQSSDILRAIGDVKNEVLRVRADTVHMLDRSRLDSVAAPAESTPRHVLLVIALIAGFLIGVAVVIAASRFGIFPGFSNFLSNSSKVNDVASKSGSHR
jgi:hypothetical protein